MSKLRVMIHQVIHKILSSLMMFGSICTIVDKTGYHGQQNRTITVQRLVNSQFSLYVSVRNDEKN